MKSLTEVSQGYLRAQLQYAVDPYYMLQVEAAGNIVSYRNYLATTMGKIHEALSLDKPQILVLSCIYEIWDSAPYFS